MKKSLLFTLGAFLILAPVVILAQAQEAQESKNRAFRSVVQMQLKAGGYTGYHLKGDVAYFSYPGEDLIIRAREGMEPSREVVYDN